MKGEGSSLSLTLIGEADSRILTGEACTNFIRDEGGHSNLDEFSNSILSFDGSWNQSCFG